MIKKDFLLEIGVEEIPASYIAGAMNTIEKYFIELLSDEKLTYEKVELFSTPRRFAIRITEIQAKQADETIERVGPTKEIAYDADGNLTKIEITEDNVKTTVTFTYDADGNLTKITKTIEVI